MSDWLDALRLSAMGALVVGALVALAITFLQWP